MRVRLLGSLDVTAGGVPRPVPGTRRKAVLAVLALRAGEIVSRDWLIDAVWADRAPATVANSLQRHVSYLRDVLDARSAIVSRAPGYVLQLPDEATDVRVAERLIRHSGQTTDRAQAAAQLRTALSLWRGEALADVRGHGWLEEQAQRLDQLRHGVVRELIEARLTLGEHAHLVPELQHLAQQHPSDEDIHRQLMLALHRTGRQAEALATFERLRAMLSADLGIDPGAAIRELRTAILRHDPSLDPPPTPVTVVSPRSVPASRGALIGRVDDLKSVGRLLRHHRLVTISGPGGVGKSTLAAELARDRLDDPEARVSFVELDSARHRADAMRAVAEAAGVHGAGAADLAELAAILSTRLTLLVLDNCEHLLDACAELVDAILDAGPGVRVLATSREALGVDGEGVHPLGSLGRDAAPLFVARATAATGRAVLEASDPDVVELCERLDGLPLAIELAAAQLRHLTLRELTARLDDRLRILAAGRPRAGHRHATLATAIEWSYQLLDDVSRTLFERLGVFLEGFDLSAVRAVGAELDEVTATNAIGGLVAKSLVVHDPGIRRYRLLETIRLFARERLVDSGRCAETTERLWRHLATAVPRSNTHRSAVRVLHQVVVPVTELPDLVTK